MTRRTAIAMSGLVAASLMAGMVGAQVSAARLAGSAAPVKVVRQVQVQQAPVRQASHFRAEPVDRE
jgi:hypothetical protein